MANIPEKSKKLYNFSNKKKTDKINYFQFTFQGSKNTANKKTRQNILSKKAAKLKKKPYRIGYNPLKPGNLLTFLFPFFSQKSVKILENNATKHFVEISAENHRKILVKNEINE